MYHIFAKTPIWRTSPKTQTLADGGGVKEPQPSVAILKEQKESQIGKLTMLQWRQITSLADNLSKFNEAIEKMGGNDLDMTEEDADLYIDKLCEEIDLEWYLRGATGSGWYREDLEVLRGLRSQKMAAGGGVGSEKSINLYFKEGTSDKEYHLSLEKSGDGYVVNFDYGRVGSALISGTKTNSSVSYDDADKIYEKIKKEKIGKGYHEN